MKQFDAIFIGSGHNALIAAAYLSRAAWSVLVLERNDRPGGLVRTEELTLPGFRHDVYSSSHPLFVTSLPDGQSAVFFRDLEATAAEADRLFPGDGQAFREMMDEFNTHAGDIFPLFGLDLASPEAAPFLRRLSRRSWSGTAGPWACGSRGERNTAPAGRWWPPPTPTSSICACWRTPACRRLCAGRRRAATWPGHGVNGGSGYIVAQQLLKGQAVP